MLDDADLAKRISACLRGLLGVFDQEKSRWRSTGEDDLFTNYVVLWALSEFGLARIRSARRAAEWIAEQRGREDYWLDATGAKPIEMTNRALIALLLSGLRETFREIELYVTWVRGQQEDGAWVEETKHMGGATSYGPTLPATFLLRLVQQSMAPTNEHISASLRRCQTWLENHHQAGSVWTFAAQPGSEPDPLAVAWALRIYANCTSQPHDLLSEGAEILRRTCEDRGQWSKERYHVFYNALHSLALGGMGLDDPLASELAQWLLHRYQDFDLSRLPQEYEGIRMICGCLIAISKALEHTTGGARIRTIVEVELTNDRQLVGDTLSANPTRSELASPGQVSIGRPAPAKSVFVVHGRDKGFRAEVLRFLEKLVDEVTVLEDEPTVGSRAIIEKLEAHASVSFALVLMSPDDLGKLGTEEGLKPRARQNVILELGYFLGRLGRGRVVALVKNGLELPSDYHGVVYVPFEGDTWKFKLGQELRQAGLPIDMNKVI